jgi:hypothetical protein
MLKSLSCIVVVLVSPISPPPRRRREDGSPQPLPLGPFQLPEVGGALKVHYSHKCNSLQHSLFLTLSLLSLSFSLSLLSSLNFGSLSDAQSQNVIDFLSWSTNGQIFRFSPNTVARRTKIENWSPSRKIWIFAGKSSNTKHEARSSAARRRLVEEEEELGIG